MVVAGNWAMLSSLLQETIASSVGGAVESGAVDGRGGSTSSGVHESCMAAAAAAAATTTAVGKSIILGYEGCELWRETFLQPKPRSENI